MHRPEFRGGEVAVVVTASHGVEELVDVLTAEVATEIDRGADLDPKRLVVLAVGDPHARALELEPLGELGDVRGRERQHGLAAKRDASGEDDHCVRSSMWTWR